MDFYQCLNYSLGNEDWNIEAQALRINSGDKAVCVTASGDRPLHLLMTDCNEVLSIDMNPIQNYLLDLKLAAIKFLDYEKYLAFLGIKPCHHRKKIFYEIKNNLISKGAQDFWEKHLSMITRGIIYQGKTERLTYFWGKFLKLLRPYKINKLFKFDDIESQREFLNKKWDTPFWQKTFETLINSDFLKFILNDPGLNSNELNQSAGQYVYQRMIKHLQQNLASKSPMLQLILTGRLLPEAYFPYLTWEGYNKIRQNPDRLHYQTGNIVEFLNSHQANSFDCFSMSDIASYMPQDIFEKLLAGIQHSGKPQARFCIREFMSMRTIPQHLTTAFKRAPELEQKFETEESNFVYRFIVGELQK